MELRIASLNIMKGNSITLEKNRVALVLSLFLYVGRWLKMQKLITKPPLHTNPSLLKVYELKKLEET